MPVGPDFISQLNAAAAYYEDRVGLRRAPASPPGAVALASDPIPFAVREPLPDTDIDSGQPGLGTALWLHDDGAHGAVLGSGSAAPRNGEILDTAQALHDQLGGRGVTILTGPYDRPFGRTFALRHPDGYALTIHDA